MNRRDFLRTAGLSVAGLAAFSRRPARAGTAGGRTRPNILFCIADDWGWPHAGAYGDPVVKTPTFDRLAREGVLFEHAYVAAPSCTPCRNAILTGQWHWRLGEGANLWSTLHPRHPVFPYLMEEAGYVVGHWRKAWGPGNWKALGRTRDPCRPGLQGVRRFPGQAARRQAVLLLAGHERPAPAVQVAERGRQRHRHPQDPPPGRPARCRNRPTRRGRLLLRGPAVGPRRRRRRQAA